MTQGDPDLARFSPQYIDRFPDDVAAFAATIRILVQALGPLSDDWVNVIAVLALVTMAFGNIVAIAQRNVKRMLAYSSIAHAGFVLTGVIATNDAGIAVVGRPVGSGDQP